MFSQNNGGNTGNGPIPGGIEQGTDQHHQQHHLSPTGSPPMSGISGTQHQQHQQQHQQQQSISSKNIRRKAYVKITEQPASKALRFRYECEGRSAGSIPGINSTPENKTFPTIEIVGYKGRAVVVVSCVTKDPPYRPHPHNLVGKEGCKKGVCTVEINSETMRAVFSNLGIQCVKKKDIENALRAREEIRVDPFKTGFSHRFQPSSIDLNSVRLCFQVFLESEQKGRFTVPLPPVVSDPIYDKKAMSDLVICTLCSCSSTVAGGKEIILLCEKVAKEDISIRFFEEHDNQVVWEAFGDFQHTDVHKQTAIKFRTPRYKTLDVEQPIKVFIQLRRPSDGATSEPLPFDYLPLDSGRRSIWSLRKGTKGKPDIDIFRKILEDDAFLMGENNNNDDMKGIISNGHNFNEKQTEKMSTDVIDLNTPVSESPNKLLEIGAIAANEATLKRRQENEIDNIVNERVKEMEVDSPTTISESVVSEQNNPQSMQNASNMISNDKTSEWIKSSEFERTDSVSCAATSGGGTDVACLSDDDKTLNDLLEQVAELDEIYVDHHIKRDTLENTLTNELISGIDHNQQKSVLRTDTVTSDQTDLDELFDDTATYTSLQKAFRNPILMNDIMPPTPPASQLAPEDYIYDPIEILVNPPAPVIDVNNLKRENVSTVHGQQQQQVEEEKLPPLPPKRVRKQDNIENRPNINQKNQSSLGNDLSSPRPQSQIIIMKTPDHSPSRKLPPSPTNNNTLPRQKKPGFFSKFFRRKSKSDTNSENDFLSGSTEIGDGSPQSKKTTPTQSREPSVAHFALNDSNRASVRSLKSLQPSSVSTPVNEKGTRGKPVARSVSSVSGKRPHLTPDIIHIPLKGDSSNSLPMNNNNDGAGGYSNASTVTLNPHLSRRTASALQLADVPLKEGNMELVAIADAHSLRDLCQGNYGVKLDPNVDLTEAEHFALYTTIAPHATASEFDENSCYYAPVDAGEILTPAEMAKRLTELNQ